MEELLQQEFYGNSVIHWIASLAIAALIAGVLGLVKRWAKGEALTSLHQKLVGVAILRECLASTRKFFILALALSGGLHTLHLHESVSKTIIKVLVLLTILQVALWGNSVIARLLGLYLNGDAVDGARATAFEALSVLAKIIFYSLLILWGLDNLGVNVTTLVAGLGVGGVAIALAVQNILGDLFASFSIVLDKPFVIGDSIVVGTLEGTVEHVGIKTTRIRSVTGEQLIFPNAALLQSNIRNFKRMSERRVKLSIGVTYETPLEKIRAIPEILTTIITSKEQVRFDRAHFVNFGESSLNFEAIYWILDPSHALYMDTQQTINFEILETFQRQGIEFAYPTRTIHGGSRTDK